MPFPWVTVLPSILVPQVLLRKYERHVESELISRGWNGAQLLFFHMPGLNIETRRVRLVCVWSFPKNRPLQS